jgi:hypothetical protein
VTDDVKATTLIWYVAYGSNLLWSRFRCYLAGGTPDGSSHTNPGARDRADPVAVEAVQIRGQVRFAGQFDAWGGGGVAFFDPNAAGVAAGRAYLITVEQLNDVVAQENDLPTGTDFALESVFSGGALAIADALYESVVHVGSRASRPMLTLTSTAADLPPTPPSAAYLWTIASGLRESHAWTSGRIAAYLSLLPGVKGHWTVTEIEQLVEPDTAPTAP